MTKEYSLDDAYVSLSSDQSQLKNSTNIDIMKFSNLPVAFEQFRKLPNLYQKKKDSRPPQLSEEITNDLEVLQMRSVLDKKRFYKKNSIQASKDIQVGTVLDSPADFYSSRIPKKLRKQSLVDELLSDAKLRKDIKNSYKKIIKEKKLTNPSKYKKWKKERKKRKSSV